MPKTARRGFLSIALALATALTIGLNSGATYASSSYAPGDPYVFRVEQDAGLHNIYFHDSVGGHGSGGLGNHSFLLNQDIMTAGNGRPTVDPTCSAVDQGSCATASSILWNSEIPQCASDQATNCISGFGVLNDDNSKSAATFQSYFPSKAQNAFIGDESKKIPTGATASVYSLKDSSGKATTFMVKSYLSGQYVTNTSENNLMGFNVSIVPVEITPALNPGPCITNETNSGKKGSPCSDDGYVKLETSAGSFYGEAGGVGATCNTDDPLRSYFAIANFDKLCAVQVAFPNDDKYYVTLRLNNPPSGWMHGRLKDPVISMTKASTSIDYEFVGRPVLVPVLYKSNYWKDLPTSITSQYGEATGQFKGSNCDGTTSGTILSQEDFKNPLLRNFTAMPCSSGELSIKELNLWLPYLNNTATATPYTWSLRTITEEEAAGTNKCFSDPKMITGLVTTNSTTYTSGPPAFDKAAGTLNYKVASPHFMQDGTTLFRGVYNLIMRSDVARCIYGFSTAPISASVSVISENGTNQIATTVVGERNGWISLSAANFEFSSPRIAVKLTQKSSISCVKGKVTKKISGTNPKCPKGYTKK